MSKVTLKDVAKAAGVSIGTVSRVINQHPNVKADFKARVNAAIAELGFEPNIFAQAIRGGKSKLIGVIIQDITSVHFARFVQTAQRALSDAGYMLVLAPSYGKKENELSLLSAFASRKIDGVIMTSCDEEDQELILARKRLNVPVVLFDRESSDKHEDAVIIDHFTGTRQAMRYLLDLGHKRIAVVTGQTSVHPARDRIRAYKEAYAERGLDVDDALINAANFETKNAFVEASKLLSLAKPPTAIVAGGTSLLAGILSAVRKKKLRIPEDISIIASSETNLSTLGDPPISVIRWDSDQMGRAASQLLLDRLSESKNSDSMDKRVIKIPTEFLIEGSCTRPKE